MRGTVAGRVRRALRQVVRVVGRAVTGCLVAVLRLWQLLASPTYGQTCRFYPSCSAYGVEALRTHGAARGSWLTVRRLARCHPWNPGGVDPVPPAAGRVDRSEGSGSRSSATTYDDGTRDVRADLSGDHHVCAPDQRRVA